MNARRALAVAALLASCLAAAIPLYAESGAAREVGSADPSAGMDSWQAAWAPEDIDLRDSRNRRVSRADLRRELAAGSARMRGEAAGLSRLPALKALLDFLDRSRSEKAALRGERGGRSGGRVLAVEGRRAPKAATGAARMIAMVQNGVSHLVLSPLQLSTTPGRIRVLVLLR